MPGTANVADYSNSAGIEPLSGSLAKYNNSGDECNVGYDSLSYIDVNEQNDEQNHPFDGSAAAYQTQRYNANPKFDFSAKNEDNEQQDSEVTAPPTPRSTDSEEAHQIQKSLARLDTDQMQSSSDAVGYQDFDDNDE